MSTTQLLCCPVLHESSSWVGSTKNARSVLLHQARGKTEFKREETSEKGEEKFLILSIFVFDSSDVIKNMAIKSGSNGRPDQTGWATLIVELSARLAWKRLEEVTCKTVGLWFLPFKVLFCCFGMANPIQQLAQHFATQYYAQFDTNRQNLGSFYVSVFLEEASNIQEASSPLVVDLLSRHADTSSWSIVSHRFLSRHWISGIAVAVWSANVPFVRLVWLQLQVETYSAWFRIRVCFVEHLVCTSTLASVHTPISFT